MNNEAVEHKEVEVTKSQAEKISMILQFKTSFSNLDLNFFHRICKLVNYTNTPYFHSGLMPVDTTYNKNI